NFVWDFGKIESYLDLMFAHHQQTWGKSSLPIIITEFGRQGITPQKGPWFNEYSYYLYSTTITRLWMAFMDRPEVELTVPFILPFSDPGYAQQRGQAIYTRPNYPEDSKLKPTRFLDFYRFYRDFEGIRVPAKWKGIQANNELGHFALATRQGNELWILLHNAPDREMTLTLDLGYEVPSGDAKIARMRWEGETPEDYTAQDLDGTWRIDLTAQEEIDPEKVILAPEETAIIKIKLPAKALERKRIEERFYASETIQPLSEKLVTYQVNLPSSNVLKEDATLVINVSAPEGFKKGTTLSVDVNGNATEFDLGFAEGSMDLLAPIRLPLKADTLKTGNNTVTLSLSQGKTWKATIASVRIDTARIQ
ncbi:MAG: hypothetical protein AAF571_09195, partial [Verrucomicrobiota bacterium]